MLGPAGSPVSAFAARGLPGLSAPTQPGTGAATRTPTATTHGTPEAEGPEISATPSPATVTPTAPASGPFIDAPPGPVREIRLLANTATEFSLSWLPPEGEPAAHYRVRVNAGGWMQVAATTVTLGFPPDGVPARVEITAVDREGVRGEWRSLVVLPPAPPSPTPSPSNLGPELPSY